MIRFENLKKSFRGTEVLKGLDLEISKGDRIALVGSNGAGKTTMIRCLLGEYTYDGTVLVNGLVPRENRREVLKRIGFVPQLPPPLKMTVGQLLDFSSQICDSDPQLMIDLIVKLGLSMDDMQNRPFNKLSGGEKQKILISIALGRETDLLVLDEPAANLDPAARQVFFALLAERLENTSMIISSHRLDEVAALVNRVVEMDRGRIVLNDHVADRTDMSSVLDCELELHVADEAFAKTVLSWDFAVANDNVTWSGKVAGPDRLRFLGMLSRYTGLLKGLEMKEKK